MIPSTMKAAVLHAAGDLRVEQVPVPTLGPDDALVRVRACGICASDVHYYVHGRIGTHVVEEPMIVGHEVAGDVVAVGSNVSRLAVGTRVALEPGVTCGHCRMPTRTRRRWGSSRPGSSPSRRSSRTASRSTMSCLPSRPRSMQRTVPSRSRSRSSLPADHEASRFPRILSPSFESPRPTASQILMTTGKCVRSPRPRQGGLGRSLPMT